MGAELRVVDTGGEPRDGTERAISLLDEVYAALESGRVSAGLEAAAELLDASALELRHRERSWLVRRAPTIDDRTVSAAAGDVELVAEFADELSRHRGGCRVRAVAVHAERGMRAAPSDEEPVSGVSLSPRLVAVAELAARGLQAKEIAVQLDLTVSTTRTYLTRVYRRLGVRNRVELVHQLARR